MGGDSGSYEAEKELGIVERGFDAGTGLTEEEERGERLDPSDLVRRRNE